MPKYTVGMRKTDTCSRYEKYSATVEVVAIDEKTAKIKAIELSDNGDVNWEYYDSDDDGCSNSDIEVDSVEKMEDDDEEDEESDDEV